MELYFPTELPEQLAFLGAALSAMAGLFILVLPAAALRLSGFAIGEVTPEGYGSVRSTGGLYLGLGVIAIFLAQDWTYLALGVSAAMGAFGRLVSMIADRGLTLRSASLLLLQVVVAVLPLGYVLGYFWARKMGEAGCIEGNRTQVDIKSVQALAEKALSAVTRVASPNVLC